MSATKRVLFRGPALTQSGYGVHARQIVKWLLSKPGLDVRIQALPWGDTPWILDPSAYCGLIGEIFSRTAPFDSQPDVSFQLQLPNEWDPKAAAFNVGVTAGVEADRCNPAWRGCCDAMDAVVVPSNHARDGLTGAAGETAKPIHVIPEAFSDAVAAPATSLPPPPPLPTDFNFLVFGQLTSSAPEGDRKNTFSAVKWMCEKFAGDPTVGLIIKTNAGRNTKVDRLYVKNTLGQFLSQVRQGPFPKVALLHGDMSDEEVASLYRDPRVKALVTLTRGEGFGLPILEAAASGLPVVAPGWSGHTDFMRLGKYTEISYHLKPVPDKRVDGQIFVKGARWAEPSEEDFKKRIGRFHESPDVPREWAVALAAKLRATHSAAAVEATYDRIFGEVLGC